MNGFIIFVFSILSSCLFLEADDLNASFPYSDYNDDLAILSYLKDRNPRFKLEYCFMSKDEESSFYVLSDGPDKRVIISRVGEIKIDAKVDGVAVNKSEYFDPVGMKVSGQVRKSDGSVEDVRLGSLMFNVGHCLRKPHTGVLVVKFSQTADPKRVFEIRWGEDVEFVVKEIKKEINE